MKILFFAFGFPSTLRQSNLWKEAQFLSMELDRLSALPDCLLSLILSKLSIRDAIKCSVLSTRWRFLYTEMLDLILSPYLCSRRNTSNTGCALKWNIQYLKYCSCIQRSKLNPSQPFQRVLALPRSVKLKLFFNKNLKSEFYPSN